MGVGTSTDSGLGGVEGSGGLVRDEVVQWRGSSVGLTLVGGLTQHLSYFWRGSLLGGNKWSKYGGVNSFLLAKINMVREITEEYQKQGSARVK